MKPREGTTRGEARSSSTTSGSLPLAEERGGDQSTSSSSSEIDEGMLKQIPSGDLEVPAPGGGVKEAAVGLRGRRLPSGGVSSTGDFPSRRGGEESPIDSGGGEGRRGEVAGGAGRQEAADGGGGRRDRSGHRRGSQSLPQLEKLERDFVAVPRCYASFSR